MPRKCIFSETENIELSYGDEEKKLVDLLNLIYNTIHPSCFYSQVDAAGSNTTSTAKGGGLMVLPSILSFILPAGLLAFLFHDLHC